MGIYVYICVCIHIYIYLSLSIPFTELPSIAVHPKGLGNWCRWWCPSPRPADLASKVGKTWENSLEKVGRPNFMEVSMAGKKSSLTQEFSGNFLFLCCEIEWGLTKGKVSSGMNWGSTAEFARMVEDVWWRCLQLDLYWSQVAQLIDRARHCHILRFIQMITVW